MISSSYFPPTASTTPQRDGVLPVGSSTEKRISGSSSNRSSPNFNSMPVNEILTSAPTRSAFLQSLQRSREREERREREISRNEDFSDNSLNNSNNSNDYSAPTMETIRSPRNSSSGSVSGTPIMSRRRISSSNSTPPLKPMTSATPSKLASHAFTMSRSSTEDETSNYRDDLEFRRRYENDFYTNNSSQPKNEYTPSGGLSVSSTNQYSTVNTTTSSNTAQLTPDSYTKTPTTIPLDIQFMIDSALEMHTSSIKNDLQNLHVELIKQSVAQQNAFRSLLETYLPLTGKLMDTLAETREENERLKMRIEELSRRRF